MTTDTRTTMLDTLHAFINQRPGFESANYNTRASYQADQRRAARDADTARELLARVERSSITAEDIASAARSGRLTWDAASGEWDYCTGQYFPTEYRRAAAQLLSSVLWSYYRDQCACDTREKIQAAARRDFRSRAVRQLFN